MVVFGIVETLLAVLAVWERSIWLEVVSIQALAVVCLTRCCSCKPESSPPLEGLLEGLLERLLEGLMLSW